MKSYDTLDFGCIGWSTDSMEHGTRVMNRSISGEIEKQRYNFEVAIGNLDWYLIAIPTTPSYACNFLFPVARCIVRCTICENFSRYLEHVYTVLHLR